MIVKEGGGGGGRVDEGLLEEEGSFNPLNTHRPPFLSHPLPSSTTYNTTDFSTLWHWVIEHLLSRKVSLLSELKFRNRFCKILRLKSVVWSSEKLSQISFAISAPLRNILSVNEKSDFVVKPNILLISNLSSNAIKANAVNLGNEVFSQKAKHSYCKTNWKFKLENKLAVPIDPQKAKRPRDACSSKKLQKRFRDYRVIMGRL